MNKKMSKTLRACGIYDLTDVFLMCGYVTCNAMFYGGLFYLFWVYVLGGTIG